MIVIRHMVVRGRVQGVGYRAFVEHEALRRGLARTDREQTPFEMTPRDMGLRPGIELDDIHSLLERLESPEQR